MTVQSALSSMRRAVTDYAMIADGDRIVVGLSGGKDSTALLALLAAYRRFSPQRFELFAATVDMGLGANYTPLADFCAALDVPYTLEKTDIGPVIFDVRKEKSPCSLCSKMRRGALNTIVARLNANKLALGHHADDLVETMLLSLCYEGRFSTFAPLSFMDRSGVTLIRPMVYLREGDVAALVRNQNYPIVKNPCKADHNTRREYMKQLVKSIQKEIPFAFDRMLGAITHPERNNLWPPRAE
jgi:tRNA 2-thiocytidine biosynthesis protein TtcA